MENKNWDLQAFGIDSGFKANGIVPFKSFHEVELGRFMTHTEVQ